MTKQPSQNEINSLTWLDTKFQKLSETLMAATLHTDRGDVVTRYHHADDLHLSPGAVLWVGGSGGGLDGPARGLYPAVCERLQVASVGGLRLHYRHPNHLEECVLDTLLGVEFLVQQGYARVALVGHSFGGAVVISCYQRRRHVGCCNRCGPDVDTNLRD